MFKRNNDIFYTFAHLKRRFYFLNINKKLINNFIIILLHNLYELYQNEPN